jgi:hypothetical protein
MKTRRSKTTNLKRTKASKAARTRVPSVADLQKQVVALSRELSEAQEQQTASSEVLQIISSSPGDLKHAFQGMLANALRLCEAQFGGLFLCEGQGQVFRLVAVQIRPARVAEFIQQESVVDLRQHHPQLALARVARTIPWVRGGRRLTVEQIAPDFWRSVARFGFMDRPDIPALLREAQPRCGGKLTLDDVTYYVGHETIIPREDVKALPRWLEALYAMMQRNSVHVTSFFRLPADQVVEIGREISI